MMMMMMVNDQCRPPVCPQWESQHAGLSCEQYQSWKRENDPEYQRQGLAGYLRDNGISQLLHLSLSLFISLSLSLSLSLMTTT